MRDPTIVGVMLGEWTNEFYEWTVDGDKLIFWIEELEKPLEEGAPVDLNYFGPSEGDTASAPKTEIATIEPAHGGFHLVFRPGDEFLSPPLRIIS